MAKRIVDEILKYTIEINGDPAQKELIDLEKQQRKLTAANKDLREEKKRMQRENLQNTKRWKEVTTEMAANNRQIKSNEAQMAELRGKIGITALTMKQLKSEATRLRLVMSNMVPGSEQYLRYQADLNKVNARMRELRVTSKATGLSIGRIADKFNRFAALGATVVATLTGMVLSFQKVLDFSGKLSDAQADVAKTTGLSSTAVDDLTIKLGLFKTRSARLELLALAEEAGRLGKKSTEDILEFVKTGDKIKVALGDDLQGDVNDNIRIIGKLTEQYRVGAEFGASFGEGMEMIGSAINEVSASGTAQADYLVDFLSRMVGISQQAGIAAEDMVGVAAVLDEAGQQTETSATALTQVIVNMSKDTATYAEIAGMGVQEFADLVKNDANEALLVFLQGLNGNNEGLTELAQKFDGLGIDGTRAITVLSALAGQTEKIRDKQDLANKSLNEATSLTDEARKKNENFGAVLDNLRKRLVKIVLEGGFVAWLQDSVTWVAKFVGAIDDADGSVTAWREKIALWTKIVIVATTALVSYKVATELATLWGKRAAAAEALRAAALKVTTFWTNAAITAQALYIIGANLLTGSITLATAAQRAWNVVMAASPWGAVLAIVSSVGVAYALFADDVEKLTTKQRILNDISAQTQKNIAGEKAELDRLLSIVRDETIAKEERLKAMKNLQAIAPDYLGDIELEEINTLKAKKAIDRYIESLEKKAMAQAIQEKRTQLYKQLIDAEGESISDNLDWFDKTLLALGAEGSVIGSANTKREHKIQLIKDEIAALSELEKEKLKAGDIEVDGSPAEPAKPAPVFLSDEEKKKQEKYREAREQAERDIQDFLRGINQDELDAIKQKFEEKIELAKKYGIDTKELEAQLANELKVARYERDQKEREDELTRKKELLDSNLKQLWDHQDGLENERFQSEIDAAGDNNDALEKAKSDHQKRLEDLHLDHLEIMLDAYRAAGLETIEIEKAITDAKLLATEKRLEADQKQRESAIKSATTAAFSSASQIKSSEDAKSAILNAIRDQIAAYIAEAIAKFVADQIKEQGWLGLITGAAAGAAAGALFNAVIPSFDGGMYDVIDDKGDQYRARQNEDLPTGMYTQPTFSRSKNMLVAEKRPELVVDGLTTQRLIQFRPDVIDAIKQEARGVRGYASGNYPGNTGPLSPSQVGAPERGGGYDPEMKALLYALMKKMDQPAFALLPDKTVKAINDRNALEKLVRDQSIMNG